MSGSGEPSAPARILWLDMVRAAALAGMVVFHFVFDLQVFGVLPVGTASSGVWSILAHVVAGGFICIAGLSLVIAHPDVVRWRSFGRRLAKVAGAALLVTVATYAMMPEFFVYFGILHAIATFSLLGLAFLRAPLWLVVVAAVAVFFGGDALRSESFNAPALWWLGLSTQTAPSVDFEPLFPWFSVFLAGLILGRLATASGWLQRAMRYAPSRQRGLAAGVLWAGRHTLLLYLVHQPVLFALIWTGLQIL